MQEKIEKEDEPIGYVCNLFGISELNKSKKCILNSISWSPKYDYITFVLDNESYQIFNTSFHKHLIYDRNSDLDINIEVELICNEYNENETVVEIIYNGILFLGFSVINQFTDLGEDDTYTTINNKSKFIIEVVENFWKHNDNRIYYTLKKD